jgi:hypothetical protein
MTDQMQFAISGSYYEACNCDAICPCRRVNGAAGGRSSYGNCDFLLNWNIVTGHFGDTDLGGVPVALAGRYHDDEPGSPWSVHIYIGHAASDEQLDALAQIFQGKAGGNLGFTSEIANVLGVRRANIAFGHEAGAEYVTVDSVAASHVDTGIGFDGTVSCGIPGHENPGTEYVCSLRVDEPELAFAYRERCGFATNFAYHN